MLAFIENFGAFIVLIGVMIMVHEFGHYWAARWFDVHVEAFSFGIGPRLFGFRRGETDFRFSLLPFGGFVRMLGQSDTGDVPENTNDPRSFLNKPRWQRFIIVFAGPAINIVLAVALLAGVFMVRYPKLLSADGPATIGHVVAGTPAAKAGVQEGDRIVRIDGKANPTWEDVVMAEIAGANREIPVVLERKSGGSSESIPVIITPTLEQKTGVGYAGWSEGNETLLAGISPGSGAEKAGLQKGDVIIAVNGTPLYSTLKLNELVRASEGKPLEILYARNGERNKVEVTPTFTHLDSEEGRWMIGVVMEPRVVIVQLPIHQAIAESIRQNVRGAGLIFQVLRGIVEQRVSPKSLEGPLRIGQLSGEAAREGAIPYFSLMAMISLNLAIFNLLPIPILDGGQMLMLAVEMVIRRDISIRVKETVLKFGLVFLMAIVAFVLYNDISKILPG